ncbi:MAG: protein translocase subunit SecD [bacterium]|nr:protein translocase subunit SecD [bacterium]
MNWKPFLFVLLIIGITTAGVFFTYPTLSLSKFLPWKLGLDLVGGSYLVYDIDVSNVSESDQEVVVNGLRNVIEKRVNLFGVGEPRVTTSTVGGAYRLNVELAGITDINEAIKQIGETPLLQFAEVIVHEPKEGEAAKPEDTEFFLTSLTGRYIKGAQIAFNQTNLPIVSLEFNDDGADLFEIITKKNVGKYLAIFLDGQPIEIARVSEAISGGKAQISGIQDIKAVKSLVERLNAGALPAPITLVNQQTVSATLGQESLNKTLWAGLWGTVAVMIFMVLLYRGLGIFAALALGIYVILLLAFFKLFTVTMTLAGIAGFILSIGMAVDANILIFERMKEELKKGFSKTQALEEGFKRAWTSIRDSNLSTILTGVILYNFTSSFVRGFALTLIIGVLLSMFTALTVTRNLLQALYIRK